MKKKKFLAPEIKVVEIEAADIICESTFPSSQNEGWGEYTPTGWY